jgi:predicted RNase H-like nuclease
VGFRRDVLRANAVNADYLPNADRVDAAMCALTGLIALQGDYEVVGDPDEGVVLLPRAPTNAR